jgi:hypothetical protein
MSVDVVTEAYTGRTRLMFSEFCDFRYQLKLTCANFMSDMLETLMLLVSLAPSHTCSNTDMTSDMATSLILRERCSRRFRGDTP